MRGSGQRPAQGPATPPSGGADPPASELARRIRVVPVADPRSADAALARRAVDSADRGDWGDVLRLVRAHASRIDLTDPAVWPAVFTAVPASALDQEPELAFIATVVRSFGRGSTHVPPEQRSALRALEGLGAGRSPRSDVLALFPEVEVERVLGRFDVALDRCRTLRERLVSHAERQEFEDLVPAASILLGATLLLVGRFDDAIGELRDCERAAQWTGHPIARFAGAYLALAHLLADSPREADRYLASAPTRRTAPRGSWTFIYESETLFVPVLRALADADRRAAEAALERIDEHAERSPFGWLVAHAEARRGLLWGDGGGSDGGNGDALAEARRAFVNAGALAGPGTLARSVFAADVADLALAQGRAEEAMRAAFDGDSTVPTGLLDAVRARLDPEIARNALADSPGRRARASVALIDASEAGASRNRAFKLAARTILETGAAASAIETSRASRPTLWALLGRDPGDRPTPDFAPGPRGRLGLLSPRELEVLHAIDATSPAKQLSARLSISENTLKTHLKSMYRKLGVTSRQELVRLIARTVGGPAAPPLYGTDFPLRHRPKGVIRFHR